MFSKEFWKATAERAVKTFAQAAVSFFVVGTTGLFDVEWVSVLSVSGAAALVSLLTSIASAGVNGSGPSLVHAEQVVVERNTY